MRRLVLVALIALASIASCKRRDHVVIQATEEEGQALASVIHVADPRVAPQLVSGFYDVEQNSWRWTKSKFVVTLRPPAGSAQKGATLQVKFSMPEPVTAKVGAVTVNAKVAGTALPSETYAKSGESTFSRDVPASLLNSNAVKVEFALDKFLPPSGADQRELGIIISTIGFEAK